MSVRPPRSVRRASPNQNRPDLPVESWRVLRALGLAVLAALGLALLGAGCSSAEPGSGCTGSACQGCAAGLSACGSACVTVASDPQNCGACGKVCAAGLFCNSGVCANACSAPTTACGAACSNLTNDAQHCGSCSTVCGAGQLCTGSQCTCSAPGQRVCAGACTDVQSDVNHCGACGVVCSAGQSCSAGLCSGNGSAGASGAGGGVGSAGAGGGGAGGAGTGTGSGFLVGTVCFPTCASAVTDPDGDGYGHETGRSCVVAGSRPSMGAAACAPPVLMPPVPPGNGYYVDAVCIPRCQSDATDPDPVTGVRDGYGYEMGKSCIVAGSVPALGAFTCVPPASAGGDGYQVGATCVPACLHANLADVQGYGYEAQQTCVVTGSMAALQNARCALMPRTLPPPGSGFLNGETCFPSCTANALEVTAAGYGFDLNRSCIVPASTAAIQSVPCVPPPSTVTGACPRPLTCPVVNGTTLTCGCTWIDGLLERKQQIMATAGASQYFVASAMMETATLTADYTLGDGKTGDAFNAGISKQNWSMIRRCHPAYMSQTAAQFMTSTAMNSNLALDIQVYNECRTLYGANWWSGHRGGFGNLGSTSQDVLQFKAAMDWTNTMLTGHLGDDVRFWVTIQAI